MELTKYLSVGEYSMGLVRETTKMV